MPGHPAEVICMENPTTIRYVPGSPIPEPF